MCNEISPRNSLFQPPNGQNPALKRGISACNMAYIAMQNGLFRIAIQAVLQNCCAFPVVSDARNRPRASISLDSEVLNPNRSLDRGSLILSYFTHFSSAYALLSASCFPPCLSVARYAFVKAETNLSDSNAQSAGNLMTDSGLNFGSSMVSPGKKRGGVSGLRPIGREPRTVCQAPRRHCGSRSAESRICCR